MQFIGKKFPVGGIIISYVVRDVRSIHGMNSFAVMISASTWLDCVHLYIYYSSGRLPLSLPPRGVRPLGGIDDLGLGLGLRAGMNGKNNMHALISTSMSSSYIHIQK
jgi:hypothetical protein